MGPLGYQASIGSTDAGSPFYSPLWRIQTATWDNPSMATMIKDTKGITKVSSNGSLETGLAGFVVNCPFVEMPDAMMMMDNMMMDNMMEDTMMMDNMMEDTMMMDNMMEDTMMMDDMMMDKDMMMDDDMMMMDDDMMMDDTMMDDSMMDDDMMMMDDMMMSADMTGKLTAPKGEMPFGGKTTGSYSIQVDGSGHTNITTHMKSMSPNMVLEGWLVDTDTGYKLSLGKSHDDRKLAFAQAVVNPWIYDAIVMTEEPIGDTDPRPTYL